jgi:hypothetical protein
MKLQHLNLSHARQFKQLDHDAMKGHTNNQNLDQILTTMISYITIICIIYQETKQIDLSVVLLSKTLSLVNLVVGGLCFKLIAWDYTTQSVCHSC